jgi:Sulfotransferase domain
MAVQRSTPSHKVEAGTPPQDLWCLDLGSTDVSCLIPSPPDSVLEYFEDRPEALLTLDITAGENWEKLCSFLGVPVPDVEFPFENARYIR